jgi:hypothetical protein
MPNWCDGTLTVYGDSSKEELHRFKEFARGDDNQELDAEKFIPYQYKEKFSKIEAIRTAHANKREENNYYQMNRHQQEYWDFLNPYPEEKIQKIKNGDYLSPYDFHCEKWGSKWNFCECCLVDEYEDELCYSFMTAWSPVVPVVIKMAEMFPGLNFVYKYHETGMCFIGSLECRHGKVVLDECREMTKDDFVELGYRDDDE